MEVENSLVDYTARFIRRLNRNANSDFCVDLVTVADGDGIASLPLSIREKGKVKGGVQMCVVGANLPAISSLNIHYYGHFRETKYGTQLNVTTYAVVPPDSRKGLVAFLSSSYFKGIGPALASQIVDQFGNKTLDVIRKQPEMLLTIRGVSVKKLQVITSSLKITESYARLSVFLSSYEIQADRIAEINNCLGANATETIKENPFAVMEVPGIGFTTADRIARGLNCMLDSQQRIEGAINSILRSESGVRGDLWTHIAVVKKNAMALLNDGFENPPVSEERFTEAFEAMKNTKRVYIRGKVCVFSDENEKAEAETAHKLHWLLTDPIEEKKKEGYLKAFEELRSASSFPFGKDQINAVNKVLCNRVCVLTGGPGTGKSTVTRAIIDSYKSVEGEDAVITLMAPTGKAAKRLSEATGLPAGTIHKTCHIYGSGQDELVDLPEGLIIVDEVSMVDAYVMRDMLNCIRGRNSHLVLVGDPDQLPSVAAGSVLSELIKSGVIPVAELKETHRQAGDASIIVDNAKLINSGSGALTYDGDRFQLISVSNEEEAWKAIVNEYAENRKIFGEDNVQILSPLRRKKRIASDAMNKELQKIFNPAKTDEISATIGGQLFRTHDRIMQIKNTEKALNGDTGVIESINAVPDDSGTPQLQFSIHWEDGRRDEYTKKDMLNVDLAYALTVHKSQGAEYAAVIIPLLDEYRCPLYSRRMLYTAITRAKERVILISGKHSIYNCARNVDTDENARKTLLSLRLKAEFKK